MTEEQAKALQDENARLKALLEHSKTQLEYDELKAEYDKLKRFMKKISKIEDKRFKSCGWDEQVALLAKQALKGE